MTITLVMRLPRMKSYVCFSVFLTSAALLDLTPAAEAQLSSAPASVRFGAVATGQSRTLPVTIANSGRQSVVVSQIIAIGAGFSVNQANLPVNLAPGRKLAIDAGFAPLNEGTAGGTIYISTATGEVLSVPLNGNAVRETQSAGSSAVREKRRIRRADDQSDSAIDVPVHSVALSWNASTSQDVIGYNIYRGITSGGPYSKINSTIDADLNYTDTSVADGQTYYYVATAVDGNNQESAYSNEAEAVIP